MPLIHPFNSVDTDDEDEPRITVTQATSTSTPIQIPISELFNFNNEYSSWTDVFRASSMQGLEEMGYSIWMGKGRLMPSRTMGILLGLTSILNIIVVLECA